MVLQPQRDSFDKMMALYKDSPSYNEGDQGFLNWFYGDVGFHELSVEYNLFPRYKVVFH